MHESIFESRVSSFEKSAFLTIFITQKRISRKLFISHVCLHLQSNIDMYNLNEVKLEFLGTKKGPTKGF